MYCIYFVGHASLWLYTLKTPFYLIIIIAKHNGTRMIAQMGNAINQSIIRWNKKQISQKKMKFLKNILSLRP